MLIVYTYSVLALVAMAAERLWPAQSKPFFRRGLITDGLYIVINVGLRFAFTHLIASAFTSFGTKHLPEWVPVATLANQPVWLQAVAVVLVLDFFFYWMHRAKHHWDWWYRLHETHHSSAQLDWLSSVRFHPFEKILDRCIYLFPLMFLGVGPEALTVLAIVDASVATFSHANTRIKYGPLKYLIVGPEMHRLHHTKHPDAQRSNFCNNLAIFDWMFGTARLEDTFASGFGVEDPEYPEGNILEQFTYAFRPQPPAGD